MAQDKEFMGHLHHDSWFGGKTIGYFAGVALLINNITGPGVPSLANMFAESGWLVPSIVFIAVWLMSSISTTMYCEAMRKIPGNSHFVGRIEYTSIVEYYFGHKAYLAAQIGLSGALQSLNIISVVQSAQVMDNAISAMFGHSCGLNISPFALSTNGTTLDQATQAWSCIDTNDVSNGNAWGCHVILTMGYLVALVLTLPMGYFNLDDNMIVQVVAFVITFLCWVVWLVGCFFSDSFDHGDAWVIPAIASGHEWNSQAGVIGTVLFNFGFVTTVPSFVNEKKPHVSVNKVVWLSTLICVIVFVVMGVPGAMAFQKSLAGPATGKCELDPSGANCAQSLMDVFTSQDLSPPVLRNNHAANIVMQLSVYLFPIVAVLSSIPVFSIVIKYNMVENGFSHAFSFFWGVVFPWLVALPLLYQPDALNQFITFSSLIFVSCKSVLSILSLFGWHRGCCELRLAYNVMNIVEYDSRGTRYHDMYFLNNSFYAKCKHSATYACMHACMQSLISSCPGRCTLYCKSKRRSKHTSSTSTATCRRTRHSLVTLRKALHRCSTSRNTSPCRQAGT
eukprot:TRINITY_DN8881_c0_g1_i1.p1 TRINITY_DN8881_c0_g1~~TRINITY_DN8881_c0_g1_i1.p1  ORF type:complete len:563 (+),score=76.04 TRINITY_DN8881_c0_g1_i1:157-1845(+)